MGLFDEEPATKPRRHEIGQDLSLLSVDELASRIEDLRNEIARLEHEVQSKGKTRTAAEALFSSR